MPSLLTRSLAVIVLGFGAVLLPSTLLAQVDAATGTESAIIRNIDVTSPAPATGIDSLSKPGPRVSRAGFVAPSAVRSSLASPQGSNDNVGAGRNVAMMGVGLAAIVVGSLIGGDGGTIIAIGGGVIGLIGLFHYLR